MVGKPTFAVSKNGKFFGYADANQIAKHPKLKLYDEAEAKIMAAKEQVAKAKKESADKKKAETDAAGKGADPGAIRKAPVGKS